MNRHLLKISTLLAFFTGFISFNLSTMEQQSLTNIERQNISLAMIKAAVERDGDTMIKILDNTPVADRKFYLDFPEYNFGFDYKPHGCSLWYKVYNNYFNLVDVGKKLYIVDDAWRILTKTEKLYHQLEVKNSKGNKFFYPIDNPEIKSDENYGGNPTKIMPTLLMLAIYSGDTKNIEQELSKRVNQGELIHSLFIAIDQNCFDCLELLLSKKEILKSTREEDNIALYRTLLQEIGNRKNIKMFELLIKKNPLDCLNKPGRYPLKDQSDLKTVLDYCSWQATSSLYSPANEHHEFFKKCAEICRQYGAKTLKELVQEGYVVPQKPESPYAHYEKGWIHD